MKDIYERKLMGHLKEYKIRFIVVCILLILVSLINISIPFLLKVTIDDISNTDVKILSQYNDYADITTFKYKDKNYSSIANLYKKPNLFKYYIRYDGYSYLIPEFIILEDDFSVQKIDGIHILNTGSELYVIEPADEEFNLLEKTNNIRTLKIVTVFFAILVLISFVMNNIQMILMSFISNSIVRDLRDEFFSRLIRADLKSIYRLQIGDAVTRISDDIENISTFYRDVLPFALRDIFLVSGILISMFWLNTQIAMIFMTSVVLFIFVASFFRKKIMFIQENIRTRFANMISELLESINGNKVIKIFLARNYFYDNFENAVQNYRSFKRKRLTFFSIFRPMADLIQNICITLVITYSVISILDFKMEIGILVAFVTYSNLLYKPLNDLSDKYILYQTALVSYNRVNRLEIELTYLSNGKNIRSIHQKSDIEFKNVSFGYMRRLDSIKNVSFKIPSGTHAAIVGEANSGKEVFADLISRFYDADLGSICIGGEDIKNFSLENVRKNIAVISSNYYIFEASIYDNIRMYNSDLTDDEIENICRKIGIEDFILSLNSGYRYIANHGGEGLSVGQKYSIEIARAIASKPEIIIFDELSDLQDMEVEKLLIKLFDEKESDFTIIRITNNIKSIRNAQLIIVMDDSELVEIGNHRELLKNKSTYYKLYGLQYIGNQY